MIEKLCRILGVNKYIQNTCQVCCWLCIGRTHCTTNYFLSPHCSAASVPDIVKVVAISEHKLQDPSSCACRNNIPLEWRNLNSVVRTGGIKND